MSMQDAIDNTHTLRMATFVSSVQFEDIARLVRERIKLLILDFLGCALYGADLPWTRILQNTLTGLDSTRTCSVWGTALRLSAPHAALVNGTQVQGFELDDVHQHGVMHVGAVTLPALMTIAEAGGMSGKGFLTAAIAGYESGPRVGIAMGQEHIEQGKHSGATLGVFSAASAASRALNLSVEQTVHALGIALKFYSCVGSNHTTLDAIKTIRAEHPFSIEELDEIVVHCSQVTVDHVGWPYRPEGLTSAQLNLPFCGATLLLEGDVFVKQFTPDCVDNAAGRRGIHRPMSCSNVFLSTT